MSAPTCPAGVVAKMRVEGFSFYYPGVTARRIAAEDVPAVRASLGPDDRIFVPATPARK